MSKGFRPDPVSFLFLPRISQLLSRPPFSSSPENFTASVYLTPSHAEAREDKESYYRWLNWAKALHSKERFFDQDIGPVDVRFGRIEKKDLEEAVGTDLEERKGAVAYVCGPPAMTDWAVEELGKFSGVDKSRVLCERWW